MDPKFTGATARPATVDVEQLPEAQQRGSHHRRAHSDNTFRVANFDDLLLFDASDLDISELPSLLPLPTPNADDAAGMAVDSASDGRVSRPVPAGPPIGHLRSLSVDSEFFDGIGLTDGFDDGERLGGKDVGERRVGHHRRSNSMDGSSTASFEADSSMAFEVGSGKKVMGPEKLAELARIDPKKAKRILANRQSAARSKERKIRYTNELERKVQTLQSEATNLSAQVTMLQRDTTDLTAENKELKLRIEALKQQAQLRDALNEAMKEELQRLKIQTSNFAAVNGNPSFGGLLSQFSSQLALHQLNNPPSQHQAQQQPQLCMPPPPSQQQPQLRMLPPPSHHQAEQQPQLRLPPSPSGQSFNGHCGRNLSDFNLQN